MGTVWEIANGWFLSGSHCMVYFITYEMRGYSDQFLIPWEMHGVPHQFLIVWENAVKPNRGRDLLYRYSYFSKSAAISFPSNSQRMVFYVILEIHEFFRQFFIPWENANPWKRSRIKIPILFPKYGYFYSIKFPPCKM